MKNKILKFLKSFVHEEEKDGFYLYDVGLLLFKILLSFVMKLIENATKKSKDNTGQESRGNQINLRTTDAGVPLVYGRQKIGVNQVFIGLSGDNNRYLHLIGWLAEGECEGLVEDTPGPFSVGLLTKFDDKYIQQYISAGVCSYVFKNGSSNQTAISGLPDGWNDPCRNTCYIYLTLTYNENYYADIPNITCVLDGRKIYDPRTGTTVWSNNPALIARDLITLSRERGGMGLPESNIDDLSVIDAANYCDTKGWTCNIVFRNYDEFVSDRLQRVYNTFRGCGPFDGDSTCVIKYKDLNYESIVDSITDDDIVEDSLTWSYTNNLQDRPNTIRATWCDPVNMYELSDYLFEDTNAIADDGEKREFALDLSGVTNFAQVQQLCAYELERRREGITISFIGKGRCVPFEPFDLITITSTEEGWTDKLFRIDSVDMGQDNNIHITATSEYTSMYDDEYDLTDYSTSETTLPSPSDTVVGVRNVSHYETLYVVRERTLTRWTINFSKPDETLYPWWSYADIEISIGDDSQYNKVSRSTGGGFVIDPAQEGQRYYVRIRSANIWDAKQTDDQCYYISHTIEGKTASPPTVNPLSISASGDTINILAQDLWVEDISAYEIRCGDTWDSGLYIGSWSTSMIRLSGWKPGTFTFWVAAKSNNGKYSDVKQSGTVTVFYPANYTDLTCSPITFDFTSGDFDNASRYYDTGTSKYVLRCDHDTTSEHVLVGIWTSPEYDTGTIQTFRIWGDFLTTFNSTASTWESLPGETWDDLAGMGTKWYELASEIAAGRISAILYYGDSPGNLSNQVNFFEITAPEISARYIKVTVILTDPAIDAYMYLHELNLNLAYWS